MSNCVVFALLNEANGKVLMENRPKLAVDGYRPGVQAYYSYPMGASNNHESPEQAMLREAWEELAVRPRAYATLNCGQLYYPRHHYRVYPFVVTAWDGTIPAVSLEDGSELRWMDLAKCSTAPDGYTCRGPITRLLRDYCQQRQAVSQ